MLYFQLRNISRRPSQNRDLSRTISFLPIWRLNE
jgi:hypothetical protein